MSPQRTVDSAETRCIWKTLDYSRCRRAFYYIRVQYTTEERVACPTTVQIIAINTLHANCIGLRFVDQLIGGFNTIRRTYTLIRRAGMEQPSSMHIPQAAMTTVDQGGCTLYIVLFTHGIRPQWNDPKCNRCLDGRHGGETRRCRANPRITCDSAIGPIGRRMYAGELLWPI